MHRTISAALLLLAATAYGHNINPIERPDVSSWGSRYLSSKISEPVHETMTMLAYDCHARPRECQGSMERFDRLRDGKRLAFLVTGVEWNDDPSLMLLGDIADIARWRKWMLDAEDKAKCRGKHAPAPCPGVEVSDDLLYRSHYGDLQFLHAMASSETETAAETRRKMLVWARFSYEVGIGKIDPATPLSQLPDVDALLQRPGWNVHYLFARNANSKASIRKIAIGSLLHLIQDSYSDAHTARLNGCEALSHNKRDIVNFRLYKLQNPDEHKEADSRPAWLDKGDLSDANPVWASAQLLNYWTGRAEWQATVSPFLETEIWPLLTADALADAGDVDCFAG
ncbi:hypothetical protein HPT27_11875 [Permianibacter sp. IMCC34836]|uniref:hypothetical protein n=1 Tax=Permianibacter fluminis TaxID=2738515 RepID=UPI001554539F|nr:hypothetical protein [Permianibacter fluminis]NQD37725.1 hypothetical protein [Permianibacter fluminis]